MIKNSIIPTNFFYFCLLLQICIGAFVSGLDAGQIYQSWPLMNQSYFPDDSNLRDLFSMKAFETPSIVQFIHRNLAYFIILLFSFIVIIIYRNEDFFYLRNTALLISIFLFLQIFLGYFNSTFWCTDNFSIHAPNGLNTFNYNIFNSSI